MIRDAISGRRLSISRILLYHVLPTIGNSIVTEVNIRLCWRIMTNADHSSTKYELSKEVTLVGRLIVSIKDMIDLFRTWVQVARKFHVFRLNLSSFACKEFTCAKTNLKTTTNNTFLQCMGKTQIIRVPSLGRLCSGFKIRAWLIRKRRNFMNLKIGGGLRAALFPSRFRFPFPPSCSCSHCQG